MKSTTWIFAILIAAGSIVMLVPEAQADGRRGHVSAGFAVGDVYFSIGTPVYVHSPRHYHPGYRSKVIYHYYKPHKHYGKHYYKHSHRHYYKHHRHYWKHHRHSYKEGWRHHKHKYKHRHGGRYRY